MQCHIGKPMFFIKASLIKESLECYTGIKRDINNLKTQQVSDFLFYYFKHRDTHDVEDKKSENYALSQIVCNKYYL